MRFAYYNNRNMDIQRDAQEYVNQLLRDGAEQPGDKDVDSYEMNLPPWYDEKLFKKAQKFYHANMFAMFAGKLAGLLAVLSIPSILKILVFTRESSTAMTAYRRYLATIFHTMTWYDYDLKPGTRCWKSLEAVRKRHINASKCSEKAKYGFISQKDMALTQFGFMGFIAIRPKTLGVQATDEKLEAFTHLWRVIGYMIGIEDKFNLCTDSFKTTKPRLEIILNDVYRPFLENATYVFNDMATALIDGLWCFNPFLATETFLYYTKMLCDCTGYDYMKPVEYRRATDQSNEKAKSNLNEKVSTLYRRILLYFQCYVHMVLLNLIVFRWFFNGQLRLSNWIIKYFPFLAIFKFGFRNSYVRILKRDS